MVKNVLFRKTLREIKENINQYITVIIIAILSVTLFTGIYANWQDFAYKVDLIYQKSNMADAIVMTDNNQQDIKTYLDSNSINYEERLYLLGTVKNYNVIVASFNEKSTIDIPAYASVDKIDASMVLVDENFLIKNELNINDTFTLNVSNINILGIELSNIALEFTISGTMTHPEALDNSEYQPNFLYIGEEAIAKAINQLYTNINIDIILNIIPSLYNQILIKDLNAASVIDYINNNYTTLYALNRSDLPSNMNIEADIIQAKQLIYIFPIIFYLVALLIILTSISQLIDKEQKNIGLLKALGYSNWEILMHYTNIFVILCLIGGIIGIILGPLIIPAVMNQKYDILYQIPNIATPIFRPFYLLSVLLLIVIVYLTAIIALTNILKKVPATSIRGENSYNMKATLFDHLPTKKENFLTLKMALRNMKRKISRTLMVLFGVMGCSALLLCGFGIEDTLDNSIATEKELIPFDITLSYNTNISLKENYKNISNILYADEYTKLQVNIINDKMISSYLFILPETSHIFVPTYDEFSCLISSKVANEINAQAGDKIRFIYDGISYDVTITDIVDLSLSQGIFISRASNLLDIAPNNCWVKLNDNTKSEDTLEEFLSIDDISSGMTMSELEQEAENRLSSIRIMTNTIKIFAILLAIVVLYNLALLNFKERIKDIATLKVLGFSHKEIAASFLIEILILTVAASLLGLAIGYPLMYGVLVINENPLLSYLYNINISSYIYTLLLTGGFGIMVNLLMSTFINKVKMVESLKAVD